MERKKWWKRNFNIKGPKSKCLTSLWLPYLTVMVMLLYGNWKFGGSHGEEITSFANLEADKGVLECSNPTIHQFSGSWVFCLGFYSLLMLLVWALPRDHFYEWPRLHLKYKFEEELLGQSYQTAIKGLPCIGSLFLATWFKHMFGKRSGSSKWWLTIFVFGLMGQWLSLTSNVEGELQMGNTMYDANATALTLPTQMQPL